MLVRLLLGEIPGHLEFVQPGLQQRLQPYYEITQAVRVGDLSLFRQALHRVPYNLYDFTTVRMLGSSRLVVCSGRRCTGCPHNCCA